VPLLFEAGIDKRVDKVIVVAADRATQLARLKTRNGLTRAEALRRIKSQLPMNHKRRRADYVLDGTTDRKRLAEAVSQVFAQLKSDGAVARMRRTSATSGLGLSGSACTASGTMS
jgi:dephospho-CoA kinase